MFILFSSFFVLLIVSLAINIAWLPDLLEKYKREFGHGFKLVYLCKVCSYTLSIGSHPKYKTSMFQLVICPGCGTVLQSNTPDDWNKVEKVIARKCKVTKTWIRKDEEGADSSTKNGGI